MVFYFIIKHASEAHFELHFMMVGKQWYAIKCIVLRYGKVCSLSVLCHCASYNDLSTLQGILCQFELTLCSHSSCPSPRPFYRKSDATHRFLCCEQVLCSMCSATQQFSVIHWWSASKDECVVEVYFDLKTLLEPFPRITQLVFST
jgi:hypothetical protein